MEYCFAALLPQAILYMLNRTNTLRHLSLDDLSGLARIMTVTYPRWIECNKTRNVCLACLYHH